MATVILDPETGRPMAVGAGQIAASALGARRAAMNRGGIFDDAGGRAGYERSLNRRIALDQQAADNNAALERQAWDIAGDLTAQRRGQRHDVDMLVRQAALREQAAQADYGRERDFLETEQGYKQRMAEAEMGHEAGMERLSQRLRTQGTLDELQARHGYATEAAAQGHANRLEEQAADYEYRGRLQESSQDHLRNMKMEEIRARLQELSQGHGYDMERDRQQHRFGVERDETMHGYGQADARLEHELGMDRDQQNARLEHEYGTQSAEFEAGLQSRKEAERGKLQMNIGKAQEMLRALKRGATDPRDQPKINQLIASYDALSRDQTVRSDAGALNAGLNMWFEDAESILSGVEIQKPPTELERFSQTTIPHPTGTGRLQPKPGRAGQPSAQWEMVPGYEEVQDQETQRLEALADADSQTKAEEDKFWEEVEKVRARKTVADPTKEYRTEDIVQEILEERDLIRHVVREGRMPERPAPPRSNVQGPHHMLPESLRGRAATQQPQRPDIATGTGPQLQTGPQMQAAGPLAAAPPSTATAGGTFHGRPHSASPESRLQSQPIPNGSRN